MLQRLLLSIALIFCLVPPALGGTGLALPDLGSGSIRILAGTQEEHIGRSILNELRRANLVLEDPEINEYIQDLGKRLVAAAHNGSVEFTFFVIRDDSINAFALPGGYIGVHSGLITRTQTESELASVLAHEVAHITQRHLARRFEASSGMNLKSLAVLLGAIALAASGAGGDNVTGAMMLGQGFALQQQINFTRAQEYEADRVGIEILADAGFDPVGMVNFFEIMQRIQRLQNSRMPEFLSTHPLSLSRVSEASQRVQQMTGERSTVRESRSYPLMKARLGVLGGTNPLLLGNSDEQEDGLTLRYARALDLAQGGNADKAVPIFRALLEEDDSVMHYHLGLGKALLENGARDEAIAVFENASRVFPVSVPVGLAHAEALRRSDRARDALDILRDLFNRREPKPENIRFMAQIAAEAGEAAESHYYMSEYYLRTGDLNSAREQLQLALDKAPPSTNEQLQYQARFEEVSRVLLEVRANEPQKRDDDPPPRRRR